jgi:hypothetical protein
MAMPGVNVYGNTTPADNGLQSYTSNVPPTHTGMTPYSGQTNSYDPTNSTYAMPASQAGSILAAKEKSGALTSDQALQLYMQSLQKSNQSYANKYLPAGVLPAMGSVPQGYASAINVTPMSAYQDPWQLNALTGQANAYAQMYGADAAANGQIGSSYYNALGGVQQAALGANASMNNASKALEGSNYQADKNLAGIGLQTGAQRFQTEKGYDLGLNTNTTNKDIAGINANAAVDQAYLANVAKYGAMGQLLNGSGGGLGTGLGGGTGGTGGAGGGSTVMDASGSASGNAPVVPAFQSFNDIALQRKMGSQAADISRQYDTQAGNLQNSLASRGFSTKSPGFQAMLAQNNAGKLGAIMDSQRELSQNAMQYNAQNGLAYGQMGLNQYNADQDRAQRAYLAQLAASRGTLNTLLSS